MEIPQGTFYGPLLDPKLGSCPQGVISYEWKMSWALWTSRHLWVWRAAFTAADVARNGGKKVSESGTSAHKEMSSSHAQVQGWGTTLMYQACWPQRCRDLPHEPSVFSLSQGMRQKEERRGEKKTENHSFCALVICGSQCLRLKP